MEETTYTLAGNGGELIEVMVDRDADGRATDVYTYQDCIANLPGELEELNWTGGLNPLFRHVGKAQLEEAARYVEDEAIGSADER